MPRTLLALLFLMMTSVAAAQPPSVEVYWTDDDRRDTIVDFGVTREGFPSYRTLTVRNLDSRAIVVPPQQDGIDPFIIIVNDPSTGAQASDPDKEEFLFDATPLGVVVPPSESITIRLSYEAFAGRPLWPTDDNVDQVLLDLRVVAANDIVGPAAVRRFTLRALKTTRILASTQSVLRFDSVYVDPSPRVTLSYRIDNVLPRPVRVADQTFVVLTSTNGTPEFFADNHAGDDFGGQKSITWTTEYRPVDRGTDSADFLVLYRPEPTSSVDTMRTRCVGFGVEQDIRIVEVIPVGPLSVVRAIGDTIDFGDVAADGSGIAADVVVENDGNIDAFVLGEELIATDPVNAAAFLADIPILAGGQHVRRRERDTIRIRFRPVQAGSHQAHYVLTTDLRTRTTIRGVPAGAQYVTFVVRGVGRRPLIQVQPGTVDFGTIVLRTSCTSEQYRTLEIGNQGNADLVVDSIRSSGAPVVMAAPQQFVVAPSTSRTVDVAFRPGTVGSQSGTVDVYSGGKDIPVSVPFIASVVPPDTIRVRLPQTMTSRPGSQIRIPVMVDGAVVALTDRSSFRVTFDPSLLAYRSTITADAAAEGASVVAGETVPGQIDVQLRASTNFRRHDTLLWLVCDTYLGTKASTELAMAPADVRFGNPGCDAALVSETTSGYFQLDSICGLQYRTVDSRRPLLAGLYPNPAQDRATLTIVLLVTNRVAVRLVDQQGRVLRTVVDGPFAQGTTLVPIDVADLERGLYVVDVTAGASRISMPLVIAE